MPAGCGRQPLWPRRLKSSRVGHGEKGWELETADGKFLIQFQPRVQMRFSAPFDQDPFTFLQADETTFKVNRARIKIGGHGFQPWLKYYFEYELAGNALLDFKLSVEKYPGLSLRVGQWKVNYNRERVISSGRQELADRSHINPMFTVDRQQGIELFGRLSGGGAADFSYWAGVFTGTGRGSRSNDDDHSMWVGRELRPDRVLLSRSVELGAGAAGACRPPLDLRP